MNLFNSCPIFDSSTFCTANWVDFLNKTVKKDNFIFDIAEKFNKIPCKFVVIQDFKNEPYL